MKRNIAAFGGDPNNVTLFGQSAGAQSVLALMSSPLSPDLMQRAIVQSAYGLPARPRAAARETGVRVASAVGLPGADASAEQLRAVPAERLAALEGNDLSLTPGFIVGDLVVPVTPFEAFRAGTQAKIPLLIGSNSDETSVALAFGIQPAQLIKKLGVGVGVCVGGVLVRPLYRDVKDDAELGRQVVRDAVFTAFARRMAVLHADKAQLEDDYRTRLFQAQSRSYSEAAARLYIHLVDGGLADNLGVRRLVDVAFSGGGIDASFSEVKVEPGSVHKLVVVNAERDPERNIDASDRAPGTTEVVDAQLFGAGNCAP